MSSQTKYIFITGGVVSSLGKGIASASMGNLLEASQQSITFVKLDPYINLDPGTMSPFQHGEVYVTDDGAETDLDLGHYERFTSVKLGKKNNITCGKVYSAVISQERKGAYLGATVQVIPHITNQIKNMIEQATQGYDIALVEVGGTVGDIESLPFLETIRQMRIELGQARSVCIHLTYVPYLSASGEVKTKPTQHSVKELRSIGIQPDMLMCRSTKPLNDHQRQKIALFTNVSPEDVFSLIDVNSIYEVPMVLSSQNWLQRLHRLWSGSPPLKPDLTEWQNLLTAESKLFGQVKIAMVGKYSGLTDAYKSLLEAIHHAAIQVGVNASVEYVDSEVLERNGPAILANADAVLVPGGFGDRGVEGKILAAQYAREHSIPYLGICLGFQVAVIEFARHCAKMPYANSSEFDAKTPHPVIGLISEWQDASGVVNERNLDSDLGGTMRLGLQAAKIVPETKVASIYGKQEIAERHRHRYEVNASYVGLLQEAGLVISAYAAQDDLVEMLELPQHPWFVGCQFHPEFSSTPRQAHPLFIEFVRVAKSLQGQDHLSNSTNASMEGV